MNQEEIEKILRNNNIKPDKAWQENVRSFLSSLPENPSVTENANNRNHSRDDYLLNQKQMEEIKNEGNVFSRFFQFLSAGNNLAYSLSAIAIVVLLVGVGAFTYSLFFAPGQKDIQEEKKKEVIANMLKNNSLESIKSNLEATEELKKSKTVKQPSIDDPVIESQTSPEDFAKEIIPNTPQKPEANSQVNPIKESGALDVKPEEYTYRYTKNISEYGPKAEEYYSGCGFHDYSTTKDNTSEHYEYYTPTGGLYTKSVNYVQGELSNYQIGKYDQGVDEYLIYKNGDYAVRITYDDAYPISYSASYPSEEVNPERLVKEYNDWYFSESTLEERERGGVEYYVIKTTYDDFPSVDLVWVNKNNSKIEMYESFLNSEKPENLIHRNRIEVVTKDVALTEIQSIFEFEYSVPVRKLNGSDYDWSIEKEFESIKSYVEDNRINVLYPNQNPVNFYIEEAGYTPKGFGYYRDRNFYANDEFGKELYLDAKYGSCRDLYAYTEIYTSYENANYEDYWTRPVVQQYSVDESDKKIIYDWDGDYEYAGEEVDLININKSNGDLRGISSRIYKRTMQLTGNYNHSYLEPLSYPISYPVESKIISYPVGNTQPTSYPTSYPVSYPKTRFRCASGDCYIDQYMIIFEYDGKKYSFTTWTNYGEKLDTIYLNVLDSTNSQDLMMIRYFIDRAYN